MCGITGIFDTSGVNEISRELLHRMNESRFHRGPDEGGLQLIVFATIFDDGEKWAMP